MFFFIYDEVIFLIERGDPPGQGPMQTQAVFDQATKAIISAAEGANAADVQVGVISGCTDVFEVLGYKKAGIEHLWCYLNVEGFELFAEGIHQRWDHYRVGEADFSQSFVGTTVSSAKRLEDWLWIESQPIMSDDGEHQLLMNLFDPID